MGADCINLPFSEEQKADDETFESDLVAGRLQEEVVRGIPVYLMPWMWCRVEHYMMISVYVDYF